MPRTATAAVTVVVPAYNARETIGATLDALARQDLGETFEVFVVDDGSDDGTADIVREHPVATLLEQDHAGPAAARNRGAAAGAGAAIAFTDADCEPPPNWLSAGLEALADAGLVQGAVGPDIPPGPFDHTVWVGAETGLYETASLFVTREAFERVGGFEDVLGATLGKQLAEDTWFGWRVRRAGFATRFMAEPVVAHAVIPRSARRMVSDQLRRGYFPAIVKVVPELRETLFFARYFLSARTASFDLALGGALAAAALARPWPLIAALPYAWLIGRRTYGWRTRAPFYALVEVSADAVGALGLAAGSLRARRLVG